MKSKLPDMRPEVLRKWNKSLMGSPNVSSCCKIPENLVVFEVNDYIKTAIRFCRVCGAKHRYMYAETGALGVYRG